VGLKSSCEQLSGRGQELFHLSVKSSIQCKLLAAAVAMEMLCLGTTITGRDFAVLGALEVHN